jgi:enoyl-CoA hydratase
MRELECFAADGYAVLTINRPLKRNALSDELIFQLVGALDALEGDSAVRCVLLRGAGEEAFSAGYDLSSLPAGKAAQAVDQLHALFDRVERFPYPVVALLRGYAVGGGCELALAADLRIAGDDVQMGMPPARIGLVYPLPGYARFLRTVGPAATRELFYSGRIYPAADCRRLGLVTRIVPAAEAEEEALKLVREIAANAPLSLRGTKKILERLSRHPPPRGAEDEELAALFGYSLTTEDLAEGKRAFAEKRKPLFKGR